MLETHKEEIARISGRKIRFQEPMRRYTTFKVGGPAEVVCFINDLDSLKALLGFLNREAVAYRVIGFGSNLLVNDEGIRGVVILLKGDLAKIKRNKQDQNLLTVGAGLGIAGLLNYCRRNGLGGLEFLAGIPGTLGGAVTMNAGAWGQAIGDRVRSVLLLMPSGVLKEKTADELHFVYRGASFSAGAIIVEACLETVAAEKEQVARRIKDHLSARKERQPLDQASAGSIFKNPAGQYAGQLIEAAGLKGFRVGDAMISPKHANFIVNTGRATAKDIRILIERVRERVRMQSGIELEPEIIMI